MLMTVDTGGTKTLVAGFDAEGRIATSNKFPTPRDKAEYIDAVVSHINDQAPVNSIDAISVAAAGPVRHGVLLRSPNIGWENFDIRSEISSYFPGVPVFFGNDADIAGVGEAHQLPNHDLSLYVTLSTGVGTGLTYQKKLLPALERFEGGSMRINYEGFLQRWEDVASGRKFYERHGKYGSEVEDPVIWNDYAERVAAGFQLLIPLLEPDYIVVGGSMGTHYAKYADRLQELLHERIAAKHMEPVTIAQARYPEEAVIYGCYHHAINKLSVEKAAV